MKKLFSFLIISLSLFSCDKNEIENQSNIIKKSVFIDNFKLDVSPYPIKTFVNLSNDADGTKINNNLLEIAQLTQECNRNDPNFINNIVSDKKLFNNDEIRYSSIFKVINKDNNQNLLNLYNKIKSSDFTHYSQNPLAKSPNENYDVSIYIPNIETADFSKEPLICPGYEVDNDLYDDMEDYEDYIIALYDNDGEQIELLLDENTAKSLSNPVLIVVNSEIENSDNNNYTYTQSTPSNSTGNQYQNFKVNAYKINHRYDSSTRSEYEIAGISQMYNNGEYQWWGLFENNLVYYNNKRIAKVHKDNIGKWRSNSSPTATFQLRQNNPLNTTWVYFNTYEYDWYASNKSLGTVIKNNKSHEIKGRRNYTNDWYSWNPGDLQNHPVNLDQIYSAPNYSITYEYSKGGQAFTKN